PVLSLGPIHFGIDTHAHAHVHATACTPTPARPQKTCTYPAVVSSPSRGSYASSSACFVFLVLPHPSFVSLPRVPLRLSPIADGSNAPAGALNPKPHTLNLEPPHPNSDSSNGPVGARHATAAAEYADKDSRLTNAACVTGTHLR
ncbi:MAG: hypothetical protein ACPIOQ_35785, partial [Promethearchaeia archaeon]